MELAFLGGGDTQVELISNKKSKEIAYGKDISMGFETDSLDKLMEHLASNNIKIHSGPFQPNQFIRFFYVQDPDGLKIQFVENIKK